jgi:hypothetical protein
MMEEEPHRRTLGEPDIEQRGLGAALLQAGATGLVAGTANAVAAHLLSHGQTGPTGESAPPDQPAAASSASTPAEGG